MPLTLVCSGHVATRPRALEALEGAGFSVDDRHGDHPWGLPSYRSPREADDAGHPNAGHPVDRRHPQTGAAYSPDRRITFATVRTDADDAAHSELLGAAATALEPAGWVLRSHWRKDVHVLSPEEAVELRGLRARLEAGHVG